MKSWWVVLAVSLVPLLVAGLAWAVIAAALGIRGTPNLLIGGAVGFVTGILYLGWAQRRGWLL